MFEDEGFHFRHQLLITKILRDENDQRLNGDSLLENHVQIVPQQGHVQILRLD